MITTPTVFILGAGASMPYRFPSGGELVSRIWNPEDVQQYSRFGFDETLVVKFQNELKYAEHPSVDAFLEYRPEFLEIGRAAIAFHLIQWENPAFLFPHKDWYTILLNRMGTDAAFDDFPNNKVSFITFNYERSLEHYLFTALQSRYGKSADEVAKVLRDIPFVHVHGQLGYLPWQRLETKEGIRDYTNAVSPGDVDIARKGITVISENKDDSPEFITARKLMEGARKIFFLGFGYNPVNMRRLKVPFAEGRDVFGTCYHMTQAEKTALLMKYRGPRGPQSSVDWLNLTDTGNRILDYLRNCQQFLQD